MEDISKVLSEIRMALGEVGIWLGRSMVVVECHSKGLCRFPLWTQSYVKRQVRGRMEGGVAPPVPQGPAALLSQHMAPMPLRVP